MVYKVKLFIFIFTISHVGLKVISCIVFTKNAQVDIVRTETDII